MSFLKGMFHQAINYAKKIKNSEKNSLTTEKIAEADKQTEEEENSFEGYNEAEKAYKMYNLMLDESGKSGLKAIVAQCLASLLSISIISEKIDKENMFDTDLYQTTIDIAKKRKLKLKFESDPYLKYLVDAIKHAVSEDGMTLPKENVDDAN